MKIHNLQLGKYVLKGGVGGEGTYMQKWRETAWLMAAGEGLWTKDIAKGLRSFLLGEEGQRSC